MSFQSATSFESARSGNSATERLLGGECWEAGEGGREEKSAGVIPRFVGSRPCLTPGRPLKSTSAAMRGPVGSTIAPGLSSSELLRRYVEAGASGRGEEPSEEPNRAPQAAEAATPWYIGAAGSFAVPPSPPSPYVSAKPFQHLGDQQPLSPSPVRVLATANSFVGALEAACAGNKTPETLDNSGSMCFSEGDALSLGPEGDMADSAAGQMADSAPGISRSSQALQGSANEGGGGEGEEVLSTGQLLKEIMGIAIPVAVGNLSEYLPITFGMVMVGQLPGAALELDALAMANSYFNITGLAVQYGLNSALRTLCPQAVGSGRSRELNGIYVQRAFIVSSFGLVLSYFLAVNAETLLIMLGQPPNLAALAQEYCIRLQPAIAGIGWMTILQRVMQAECHIMANLFICLIVFACAPGIQYTLIHYLGLGFHGAAWASSAYNLLYLFLYVPYMCAAGLGHVFIPRKEVSQMAGMYEHISLALPGLISTLLEWASMEMVLIMAGTRTSARLLLGALGVMLNIEAIFAMCWVGFMVALSIKVGTEIGAGRAQRARAYVNAGLSSAAVCALVAGASMYVLRQPIAHMYSSNASSVAICDTAASLMASLCVLVTFNGLNCTIQGAMSGAGLQKVTAMCSLVAWYLVGAPLACGLIWGLQLDMAAGDVLLLSCAAAMLVAFTGQAVALTRHDWKLSVDAAAARREEALAESDESAGARGRSRSALPTIPIGITQPARRAKSYSPVKGSPGSAFGISPLPPHPFSFVVSSNIHLHFSPPEGKGAGISALADLASIREKWFTTRRPANAWQCAGGLGAGGVGGECSGSSPPAGKDCEKGLDPHGRTEEGNTHGGGAGARDARREGLEEPLLHWGPEA